MGDLARLYVRLASARARAEYQYRTSFVLFWSSQFLVAFLDFVAIVVIFENIPRLAGWALPEVALLYGISGVGFGLADVFISQVENISMRIRLGTFDLVLIRPLGSLFQVVADDFALRRLGKLAQATVVLVIALATVEVDWDAGRVGMVALSLLCGAVIFGSIWVVGASATFWTTEGSELMNTFTYGGNYLTQYPLSIYGEWLRRALGIAAGTAFVAYFPALYILDKRDTLGYPDGLRFAAPVAALVFAVLASVTWRYAVRHYRSTGT